MKSGVARKPIKDLAKYRRELSARIDPTASTLQVIFDRISANRKRVVFAEGEEERLDQDGKFDLAPYRSSAHPSDLSDDTLLHAVEPCHRDKCIRITTNVEPYLRVACA